MSPFPYNYPQWRNCIESNYLNRTQNKFYNYNNYFNYSKHISQRHFIERALCSIEPKNNLPNNFEPTHKYVQRISNYNHWHHPSGVSFEYMLIYQFIKKYR